MPRGEIKRVKKWTQELIIETIKKLHSQGKSLQPIKVDYLFQVAIKYFGSYEKALKAAGLSYEMLGIRECSRKWSKKKIIEEIQKLYRVGPINSKYVQDTCSGLLTAAQRYFGSYEKAVEAAGFDYKKIRRPWKLQDWIKSLEPKDMEKLGERIDRLYSRGGGNDARKA